MLRNALRAFFHLCVQYLLSCPVFRSWSTLGLSHGERLEPFGMYAMVTQSNRGAWSAYRVHG